MIQTMSDELKFKIAESVLNSNARIGVFVMELNGDFHNHGDKDHADDEVVPTDDQIARALMACVGKDQVINAKWKWAGAYWCLRWKCYYPVDAKEFCKKIKSLDLGLSDDLDCNYESIRKYCSLSFMDSDPFGKTEIRVSNMEKGTYLICRQIALNLGEELGKTTLLKG